MITSDVVRARNNFEVLNLLYVTVVTLSITHDGIQLKGVSGCCAGMSEVLYVQ